MNSFAALLDALLFTPSRNSKLRLMREYFATVGGPERGWALAALTGELVFDAASQTRSERWPPRGSTPSSWSGHMISSAIWPRPCR